MERYNGVVAIPIGDEIANVVDDEGVVVFEPVHFIGAGTSVEVVVAAASMQAVVAG